MTRPSVAILDDYQHASTSYTSWSSLDGLVDIKTFHEAIQPEKLVEILEPFAIIHAMRERAKFTEDVLRRLPNLKFITTTGMKNRGIDVEFAKSQGIVISGTTASSEKSPGTVEQTFALILALARRLIIEHLDVSAGGWQTGVATGLAGKTLGLIGVGRLGKRVGEIGKAFDMRVIAWSPHFNEERAKEAGVEFAGSLEHLLETSDVVSMHMVLSPTTKGLLGAKELSKLKRTAFVVNTSRGPLIDEDALISALEQGAIAGAGLDTFDIEPLPKDHPLRTLKNVVLSPHMGYVDENSYANWWPQTVENIHAFLTGKPLRVIN